MWLEDLKVREGQKGEGGVKRGGADMWLEGLKGRN